MNFITNQTEHFLKTNAILQEAIGNAGQWNIKVENKEVMAAPSTYFYVWDHDTDFVWMCSLCTDDTVKHTQAASAATGKNKHLYVATLGELIRVAAANDKSYGNWAELLPQALLLYAGTTQTWEMAGKLVNGGHFIVNRYHNKRTGIHSVRPFYVSSKAHKKAIPVMELYEMVHQVCDHDKSVHPEWFK